MRWWAWPSNSARSSPTVSLAGAVLGAASITSRTSSPGASLRSIRLRTHPSSLIAGQSSVAADRCA